MLRNILRWATVTREVAKGLQFAAQQVNYLGKTADASVLFPFGVYANLPPDVLTLIASVQGNPDNRVAIGCLLKDRPDLAAGETAFYHPSTGAYIIWRSGGNLEIKTDGSITVDCASATITSQSTDVDGDVNIDGDVSITGMLNADGGITAVGTVTANGKNISDTHTHLAGVPPGSTGPVN